MWRGYRALDDTPHALNPAQGFLASCNNQPTGGSDIPGFYDPYRIVRATALLQTKRTPDDMRAMQLDLTSGLATRWKSLATEGANAAGLASESQTLAQWDGSMTADSKAAALFAAWWRRMPRAVFEDELAGDWNTGRVVLDEALTTQSSVIDESARSRSRSHATSPHVRCARPRRSRTDARGARPARCS